MTPTTELQAVAEKAKELIDSGFSERECIERALEYSCDFIKVADFIESIIALTRPIAAMQVHVMSVRELEEMLEPHITDEVYCDQGGCEGQWNAARSITKALAKLGNIRIAGGGE